MAIPGAFLAYYGWRLTRAKTTQSIKRAVAASAFFAVLYFAVSLSPILQSVAPVLDKAAFDLSLLAGTVLAVPAYAFLSRNLMKREDLTPVRGNLIGRGIIAVTAVEIVMLGMRLFDIFAPVEEGHTYLKEDPWMSVGFFGPILIAWVFYKVAVAILQAKGVLPPPIPKGGRRFKIQAQHDGSS